MNQLFKKNIKQIIFSIFILSLFFNVCLAQAAFIKPGTFSVDGKYQDDKMAAAAGYEAKGTYDDASLLLTVIQTVISAFLGLIGAIFLIYILYAGYNWMTARGEEEKVTKAKDTLKRAIVGIIIIIGAYAISVFVMSKLEAGTLRGSSGTTPAAQTTPQT